MWGWLVILVGAAWYFSWWPFEDTQRAIGSSSYNAYFYYPGGTERYLGEVQGLAGCQSQAHWWAKVEGVHGSSDWSYICCRVTKDSPCASKHR